MKTGNVLSCTLFYCLSLSATAAHAQSEQDALMMKKNEFCTGFVYMHTQWDNYWEGTLKRTNGNIGTFTNQSVGYMGMFGISNKINVFASLPWVATESSRGVWKGQQGIQDLQVWLKYRAYEKRWNNQRFSAFGLAGVSTPLTNYAVDMLPFAIGMGSRTLSLRAMADYQKGRWFATAAATYVLRNNVTLDRTAYYTTQMHYTNEVHMPNATQWMVRAGYRYKRWIAEAVVDNWTTQGGFDISRNNMPFISNRMEATRIGTNLKWEDGMVKGLSLIGGGNYTVSGRNMGQGATVFGGVVYLFNLSKKQAANN